MIQKFAFMPLELSGAYLIKPFCATDDRGAFIKDYSKEEFSKYNIQYDLQEVFYTKSFKGVIRAIHFQIVKEQAKLVRCLSGKVFDVIVDLRKDSKTFGKWLSFELSGENMYELLIPEGFGHGYLVLEDAIVSYKCKEKFYGEYDTGIIWNDKDLDIKWPLELVNNEIILSEKDKTLQTFKEFKQKL